MEDLESYRGAGQFGRAYEVMLENDCNPPGAGIGSRWCAGRQVGGVERRNWVWQRVREPARHR